MKICLVIFKHCEGRKNTAAVALGKAFEKRMQKVFDGYNRSIRDYGVDVGLPSEGLRWIDQLSMVPGMVLDFTVRKRII